MIVRRSRSRQGHDRADHHRTPARLLAVGLLLAVVASLSSGLSPTTARGDVTGTKKVLVLRTYFNDYANASRYSKTAVEGLMGSMNQLWKDTSYGKIP
jgi:hypothetical protein